MHRGRRDSVAFTVVVGVLVLLGGVAMALVIGLSGAPGSLALAALLAAVPVGPLVGCFMWLDRYEPEPRNLLSAGLLWGAFVATAAALVFQGIGLAGGASERDSLAVVAPLTEEATKGAFLLLLLWWRRHELDGVLDGIVYAGMVGIGFAFTENILYLAAAYDGTDGLGPGGTDALTGTFILRCLISPFAHPLFTVFTGIGVGLAITSRRSVVRLLAPVVGFLAASLLHGLWNASTLVGHRPLLPRLRHADAPGARRRRRLRDLPSPLRAAPPHRGAPGRGRTAASCRPPTSRGSSTCAPVGTRAAGPQAHGGTPAERGMREYQAAAIELGYLHHRYLRGTAPDDFSVRGQEHVEELRRIRPYISFPGQVVPTR